MAHRFLPRVRRLHPDLRVCGQPGRACRTGHTRAHRADVRRGPAMALPSLTDRRRIAGARSARRGNRQRNASPGTRADPLRQGQRPANHVSAGSVAVSSGHLDAQDLVEPQEAPARLRLMGIDADGTNALLAPPPATMHLVLTRRTTDASVRLETKPPGPT